MKTFKTLFVTELKLNLRVLDLPIFGIGFPVLVAVLLGFVYGKDNTAMIAETFASVSTIGIAANGLMGLPLTLSGYRANKILKQWEVTPISSFIVLSVQFSVKLLLSIFSSFLVWLVFSIFFGYRMTGNIALFILSYLLVVFAVFGIGMMIASISPNTNTANILSSLAYFPMLFLSGATIPLDILPPLLIKVLQFLPLTQGINLLVAVSMGEITKQIFVPVLVLLGIGILAILISVKLFKWE